MVDGPERFDFRKWWDELSRDQRFSLSVFGICGILTLGLSFAYLRAGLTSPFLVPKSTLELSQEILKRQQESARELEILQEKDTDQDGLSDYAEIYLYKTSAYLPDTDSDGVTDAIEIAQGKNPNCPSGTDCLQLANEQRGGITTSTFSNLLDTTKVQTAEEVMLGANDPRVIGAQGFLENPPEPSSMSVAETRSYLLENHLVEEDELTELSDDGVRQVYQAAYNQALQIKEAQAQAGQQGGATPEQTAEQLLQQQNAQQQNQPTP